MSFDSQEALKTLVGEVPILPPQLDRKGDQSSELLENTQNLELLDALFGPLVQLHTLGDLIIENSGEVTPQIEAYWNHVSGRIGNQTDLYGELYQYLERTASSYRAEAAEWTIKARKAEEASERLKTKFKNSLLQSRTNRVSGHRWEFMLSERNPKLVIDNEEELLLDTRFQKLVTKVVLNKEAVIEALESDEEIPAHSEPVYALTPKLKLPEIDVGKGRNR